MAALMPRTLRIPCIRSDLVRIFATECPFRRPVISRCMSSKNEDSTTFPTTSIDTVNPLKPSPNQTDDVNSSAEENISETTYNNTRKLPSLLKPAIRDDVGFATLFRESNFVHLGNPRGKTVTGTIYRVVEDDLYIDFDWKFPCVVKRPSEDAHLYVNNAVVRLRINDLEMSTIFLGASKETSLNEANCFLMGLISSPLGIPQSQNYSGNKDL